MAPRDNRFDERGNVELYPRQSAGDRDPLDFGEDTRGGYSREEGNAIVFDAIRRLSYVAPPTSGQTFNLFTVTTTITKGWITDLGIGSPQFDWFGSNEYYIAINNAPPYNQQYDISGGPGPVGSFYGFIPVGTLNNPRRTRIPIKTNDVVQLVIAPQTTPAAGTVVYNIVVRVAGTLIR